jgi:hypothetical protein
MAYEVYIDIEHGDKHAPELDKIRRCWKLVDVNPGRLWREDGEGHDGDIGGWASEEEAVAYCLRQLADELCPPPDGMDCYGVMGATRAWRSSLIEVLPGTYEPNSGPHPPPGGWTCEECERNLRNQEHAEGCSRPGDRYPDEVELMDPATWEQLRGR